MQRLILFSLAAILCACSHSGSNSAFVQQQNGQFLVDKKPYYFIGANFWYGAILGSTGQGGNRERLLKELDFLQSIGVNNLRVLVGADGVDSQEVKVRPALQIAPGVYNDTIFDGLDFLLAEMGKRKMYAVLFINNTWEWSGGYGQYLRWTGHVDLPADGRYTWDCYTHDLAKFSECDSCHQLFFAHVKNVMTRTNRYTNKPYADDPTIMTWEVGNEPRALNRQQHEPFKAWLRKATALMRSLAPQQLIAIGSEGLAGCEMDSAVFHDIHADPNVDYITIHIWPKNWSWIQVPDVTKDLRSAIAKTNDYMASSKALAEILRKPLVVEEFGYPRDHHLYTTDDPTTARDAYYENIFAQVAQSAQSGGVVAGSNFWSWAGFGQPTNERWQPWDDYLGDPAQEEQGLNSVFAHDETIELIKKYVP
ncbi:MAG: cellulase family glycosylhydrolase [Prevotellaceae bacterium]|jgi:mannan endo-1,4-beta-mannosidase|nr:cellulase family glycosylhydrolase [Prevotellaceae bacterium]